MYTGGNFCANCESHRTMNHRIRIGRFLSYLMLSALLIAAGCAKKNPSSPGGAAGEPVILNGVPFVSISRDVTISGTILNKSGFTIYDVKIEMTVYRDDPVFSNFTDTSGVKIAVLENGKSAPFSAYTIFGDKFINAAPVWSYLPPH
jgi:hypothetical protein